MNNQLIVDEQQILLSVMLYFSMFYGAFAIILFGVWKGLFILFFVALSTILVLLLTYITQNKDGKRK